jgi:hypothetical protein
MKKYLLTIISFLIILGVYGQRKIDSLVGFWTLKDFYSIKKNVFNNNYKTDGCTDFLILEVKKNKKINLIFTNHLDTFIFGGKIKFKRHNITRVKNYIHEIIYLGDLEKCITPALREDFRMIFHRTYSYSVENNQLSFLFNLPKDSINIRKMTFVKQIDGRQK